jgi:hypothetical protein
MTPNHIYPCYTPPRKRESVFLYASHVLAGVGLIVILTVAYIATGYIEHRANECHPVGHRICAWEGSDSR